MKISFWVLITLVVFFMIPAKSATMPNCEDHVDDDRIALACNIYWEARTETVTGMYAVAAVTLNRVASDHYPDTVAEVVWQRRQFSWTHDGLPDRPRNGPSWLQALAIAKLFTVTQEKVKRLCPTATQINAALLGRTDPGCEPYRNLVNVHVLLAEQLDPTGGALFYHALYVAPYWRDERAHTRTIGRHRFYKTALVRRY